LLQLVLVVIVVAGIAAHAGPDSSWVRARLEKEWDMHSGNSLKPFGFFEFKEDDVSLSRKLDVLAGLLFLRPRPKGSALAKPRLGDASSSRGSKILLEKFGLKFSKSPPPSPPQLAIEAILDDIEEDRNDPWEELLMDIVIDPDCDRRSTGGWDMAGDDPATVFDLTNFLRTGTGGVMIGGDSTSSVVKAGPLPVILCHSFSSSSFPSFSVMGDDDDKGKVEDLVSPSPPPVLERLGIPTGRFTPLKSTLPRRPYVLLPLGFEATLEDHVVVTQSRPSNVPVKSIESGFIVPMTVIFHLLGLTKDRLK
jgi:hypothetical protein